MLRGRKKKNAKVRSSSNQEDCGEEVRREDGGSAQSSRASWKHSLHNIFSAKLTFPNLNTFSSCQQPYY